MSLKSVSSAAVIVLTTALILHHAPAKAQGATEAQEEAAKQTARQISEAISRRITQSIEPTAAPPEKPELINGWGSLSYTSLEFTGAPLGADVGQIVGGADKRFGDLFVGASLSYARVEGGGLGVDFGVHSPSISPYVAYVFNKNLFVNAIAGYSHSEAEVSARIAGFSVDAESSDNQTFTDLSLNGILPIDNWRMKAKVGHRFRYVFANDIETTANGVRTRTPGEDSYSNTVYLTGELGYRIGGFVPYFRTTIEELIPERGDDSQSVFIAAGFTYDFSDVFSAGLSYQRELNQQDVVEYNQAALDVRIRF